VSFADTLTLDTVGGQETDDEFVFPYVLTITGPGGSSTADMSCLNYNRNISFSESWGVTAVNVATISPSASIDGETGAQIIEDAYLFNQYAAATGNAQQTSDIQFAIWDIMDPGDISRMSGYDANAVALDAQAASLAPLQPSSEYANDNLFVPINGTQPSGDGEPQLFMTDPAPPAITPEPASLVLLGTGMLGAVAIMRRKRMKAVNA
jgi:hypothetical protein